MTSHPDPRHWHELPNAPAAGTVLGQRDQLADGQASMLALENNFQYVLLRSGDTVRAFVNRCSHFGVPLAQRQDLLIFKPHISISCNVHYARYRWNDGVCVSGDCEGESLLSIGLDIDAHGCIRIAP